jgi:hypothetical protein
MWWLLAVTGITTAGLVEACTSTAQRNMEACAWAMDTGSVSGSVERTSICESARAAGALAVGSVSLELEFVSSNVVSAALEQRLVP